MNYWLQDNERDAFSSDNDQQPWTDLLSTEASNNPPTHTEYLIWRKLSGLDEFDSYASAVDDKFFGGGGDSDPDDDGNERRVPSGYDHD